MFYNFYQLDLYNVTCVVLENVHWNIIKIQDLPWYSYSHWKGLVVYFLTTYINPPIEHEAIYILTKPHINQTQLPNEEK